MKLSVSGDYLSCSFPVIFLMSNRHCVEEFSIRTGVDGKVISFSTELRPALGAPLLSNAIVKHATPIVTRGPFVSDNDGKRARHQDVSEETNEEQPSFLRRYWWVLVGGLLLSSFMGPNQSASAPSATASN
jgi:hypothetical protein